MVSFIKRGVMVRAMLLCSLLLAASVSRTQTNTENFARFEFNFNNPGARAAGLGGAFISIADDATAAEANPAGLTNLVRPELSFETKGIQFKKTVPNFSHQGTAKNYVLVDHDFKNSVVSPSFASVVFPVARFTFSAFRYEMVNFQSTYYTKGSYIPPDTTGRHLFPVDSDIKMKIVNWGGAVAFKISKALSVGASFGLSHMSVQSSLNRYYLEVFRPGNLANTATIDDAANDLFFNAGITIQPLENLSFGVIFKRRPSFSLKHSFTYTDYPNDSTAHKNVNFNIPMSFGAGVSYRPTDVLTVSFDAVRVTYSRLTKDFVLTISEEYTKPSDYTSDDGFEFHAGAEYVLLLKSFGVVFRGGFWSEPDNQIRWVGKVDDSTDPVRTRSRQTQAALFQKGETTYHYTLGIGFLISNNVQFDVAGNTSTGRNEVVGSFVVRF